MGTPSNDRENTLNELLNFERRLVELRYSLSVLEWDSEEEIVTLTLNHLKNILNRYLEKELSDNDIYEWANLIEMREDIRLDPTHEDLLKELIFELANPEINGSLTKERSLEMRALK
ncbi:hypothetical protein FKX85_16640 [Echinicola soli]|uniref:Uncharacterized protein n=1 Tax=Echinicola soli TaxID=2591634 RepID=A0A514CL77_9BACT|nr:hypothetical protein [Echinicola soli]QDH80579.1 hypothetical protein FKX85_16640 [Echinicola soli]